MQILQSSKIVSCHFIGYPDRSKGYLFYTPGIYTKFVEIRHAVFLEDKMMRGSTVAPKIDLEEKRVHAPNPMIQEPFSRYLLYLHRQSLRLRCKHLL
jgi:hypothetical protein